MAIFTLKVVHPLNTHNLIDAYIHAYRPFSLFFETPFEVLITLASEDFMTDRVKVISADLVIDLVTLVIDVSGAWNSVSKKGDLTIDISYIETCVLYTIILDLLMYNV